MRAIDKMNLLHLYKKMKKRNVKLVNHQHFRNEIVQQQVIEIPSLQIQSNNR